MKHLLILTIGFSLLLSFVPAMADQAEEEAAARKTVEGVWRVTEIKVVNAAGEMLNSQPQPGFYIFTHGHYSAIYTPGMEPRTPFADAWRPTDKEKVAAYDTIIVNTGTYELTESLLITHPLLAKVPGFAGGKSSYKYRLDGNNLWLEAGDISSSTGVRLPDLDAERTQLKLTRVEYRVILRPPGEKSKSNALSF